MSRLHLLTALSLVAAACGKNPILLEGGPPQPADLGPNHRWDGGSPGDSGGAVGNDGGQLAHPDASSPVEQNPYSPVPQTQLVSGEYQGRAYRAAIPENVHGLAFYFHDTGKDERALQRVELQDLVYRLNRRLVAVVAMRAGGEQPRRWDVAELSAVANRDWPLLVGLRAHLIETTAIQEDGPVYAVGQGNGGTFASLVAYQATQAQWPIFGALVHGGPLPGGWVTGDYNTATAFVHSANDTVANPERLEQQLASLQARQIPYELFDCLEKPLHRWRFTRIPGIDEAMSNTVFQDLGDLGIIDRQGLRLVAIEEAWVLASRHPFWPDTIRPHLPAIEDQLKVVWASRTFCGNHLEQEISFLLSRP